MNILLNAIRCNTCKRVLVSLSRHDFHACACGTFTDGGRVYLRRGGNSFTDLTVVKVGDQFMLAEDAPDE
jgi:hypothetical protein